MIHIILNTVFSIIYYLKININPLAYRKGEIPRYLREMKKQTLELQRIQSEIDVNCPPGHVCLTEEERLEALEIANLSKCCRNNRLLVYI